ncbi:hypothetical protein ACGCUQ_05630 [Eubacteriales bacterium KG127]
MNIKYYTQQFKEDKVSSSEINIVMRVSNNVFSKEFGGKRYAWAKIRANNRTAYRQVIGSPEIEIGEVKNGDFCKILNKEIFCSYIMMDYNLYKELDISEKKQYENWNIRKKGCADICPVWKDDNLKIERVRIPIKALWRHPDSSYRVAIRVSLLSLAFGILSLIISII